MIAGAKSVKSDDWQLLSELKELKVVGDGGAGGSSSVLPGLAIGSVSAVRSGGSIALRLAAARSGSGYGPRPDL